MQVALLVYSLWELRAHNITHVIGTETYGGNTVPVLKPWGHRAGYAAVGLAQYIMTNQVTQSTLSHSLLTRSYLFRGI